MILDVLNIKGEQTGRTVTLPAEVFGIEPNEHVVYLAVKQYLAHQRQGTHKSKERSEISGSTRKLHKQKGTGGSRKGDANSPLLHGGARVFGPKPHLYDPRLNKKVSRLARRSALSTKATSGSIIIVEDFTLQEPKTKVFIDVMKSLGITTERSLLVVPDYDLNILKSSRNLKNVSLSTASDINVYQIMNSKKLIISEASVARITETLN